MTRGGRLLAAGALVAASGCATAGPALGHLTLRCADPQAQLAVDGAPAGLAAGPAGHRRIALRPGRHQLEVRGGGGELVRREAAVGAGDEITLSVQLADSSGGTR